MEKNKDILDAPAAKPPISRTFTYVGLVGALTIAGSAILMRYYMSLVTGRFIDLAFLNVPDWVLAAFLVGGVVLLIGIIGSYIRKEPGGILRWFILVTAGSMLFLVLAALME